MKNFWMLFLLGCSVPTVPSWSSGICASGKQETCECPNGKGTQECLQDGSGYTECNCEDGSGGGARNSSSSGSGGGECVPTISCVSVGAECGIIQDDGCGKQLECADNCSLPLTCGGSGDQFKCGCSAKTCLEQNKNCGVISDECGGMIDCGGCSNPYEECGLGDINPDSTSDPGEENICGGGCVKLLGTDAYCTPNGMDEWYCQIQGSIPPNQGCIPWGDDGTTPTASWCCP